MTDQCSHSTETARRGSLTRCPKPATDGSLCTTHARAWKTQTLKTAAAITRRLAEGETADHLLIAAPNNPHRRDLIAAVLEVGDGPDVIDAYRTRRATQPAQIIGQTYTVDGAVRADRVRA